VSRPDYADLTDTFTALTSNNTNDLGIKAVHDQHRGRQPLAHGLGVARRHVDGDVDDPGPPALVAGGQPRGDDLRGAPVDLGQQPLITGDVDQPGVEAVHPAAFPGVGAGFPLRFAAAGVVDTQHPHLVWFGGQHRIRGRVEERDEEARREDITRHQDQGRGPHLF